MTANCYVFVVLAHPLYYDHLQYCRERFCYYRLFNYIVLACSIWLISLFNSICFNVIAITRRKIESSDEEIVRAINRFVSLIYCEFFIWSGVSVVKYFIYLSTMYSPIDLPGYLLLCSMSTHVEF